MTLCTVFDLSIELFLWPEDSFQYDGGIEKRDVDEHYEQCIEKFRGCFNWHPVEKK